MAQTARVTVTEFEGAPASALRRARQGQVIEITSRGQVVARLEPVNPAPEEPARRLPPLQEALAGMWRQHGADLPEDPFEGLDLRAKGKPREVQW